MVWLWHGDDRRRNTVDKSGDLVEAVLDCPGIAGFCYTQLTDTEQETNGLLDAQRQPKFDISVIRSIFAPEDDK